MCGGVGSKMWPMSRKTSPKHFLPLINGRSLFQINYDALRLKFRPEEIFIQTNADQAQIAKKQVPEIPNKNYFIEPEMRNQGPATGFAAAKLFKMDPDEPFILVQADVLRRPPEKFIQMIEEFDKLIKRDGKLITAGIRPKFPTPGIDYLTATEEIPTDSELKIFKMDQWIDRSEKEAIEKHFSQGDLFAHANHYAWTPRKLLVAYERHKIEWYRPLMAMIDAFDTNKEATVVRQEYAKMPAEPIEVVTIHELANAYLAELNFDWIDFGTWKSVSKYLKNNNHKEKKNVLQIDSTNCFFKTNVKNKFCALIGVKDLVIIDTKDGLLVCHIEQTGRVKEVVEYLKTNQKEQLL